MTKPLLLCSLLAALLLYHACGEEGMTEPPFRLLSVLLNGTELESAREGVDLMSELEFVFSAAIDREAFERALTITPEPPGMTVAYATQSTRAVIALDLAPATQYTLTVDPGPLGEDERQLSTQVTAAFRTSEAGPVEPQPCTSGGVDCLRTLPVGPETYFEYISSFPLSGSAQLSAAIVVVHGANRDADNYYSYLISSLQEQGLADSVALVAPYFKEEAEAGSGEVYWSGNGWRTGSLSSDEEKVSSFAMVDSLIAGLTDRALFPNLDRIVITGHSSGALFTQLYAAANRLDGMRTDLTFEYVPVNSQYYYYPDGQRVNESNDALYIPGDCTGYDIFPYGFSVVPPYLSSVDQATFNERFLGRSLTYLMGNGDDPDPTLNNTDCAATLLGSTRFARGENMYTYLETAFGGTHRHALRIVEGIGHDGERMYASQEWAGLLDDLIK